MITQNKIYYSRFAVPALKWGEFDNVFPTPVVQLSEGDLKCVIHCRLRLVEAYIARDSFRLAREFFGEVVPASDYCLEPVNFDPCEVVQGLRSLSIRFEVLRAGVAQLPVSAGVRISGSVDFPPRSFLKEQKRYLNSLTFKLFLSEATIISTWYRSGAVGIWGDEQQTRSNLIRNIVEGVTHGR